MKELKFYEAFRKLPEPLPFPAVLLDVFPYPDASLISRYLIDYDTAYDTPEGVKHYALGEGEALVLILWAPKSGRLFTTIRRGGLEQFRKYGDLIGSALYCIKTEEIILKVKYKVTGGP